MPSVYYISAPGRENGLRVGLRIPVGETVALGNVSYTRSETTFSVLNLAVNSSPVSIDGVTYTAGRALQFDLSVPTAITPRTAYIDFSYTTSGNTIRVDRLHLIIQDAVSIEASRELTGASYLSRSSVIDNILQQLGTAPNDLDLGAFTSSYGTAALIDSAQDVSEIFQQINDRLEALGGVNIEKFGGKRDGSADTSAALKSACTAAYNAAVSLQPTAWFSPSSITRSGSTATLTTTSGNLTYVATGDYVTIRGAAQSEYNGTFQVTKASATTLTYTVSGTPATPATGTIEARESQGSSIFRKVSPFVFCPPGSYRFDQASVIDDASAQSVNILGYGAVFFQGLTFPAGRRLLELGKPTASVTANQPFFVTIKGVTFRDFDRGVQCGYGNANINLGRMQFIDCDFIGKIGGYSEAVRAFNRSSSLHFVRCQFDRLRVAAEVQSVDRVYFDDCRMQLEEYMPAADRKQFEGRFVLRRGDMTFTKGILNPTLGAIEDPTLKPMAWFLVEDFPQWATGTVYSRGDVVYCDGGEGTASVSSITRSGTTATVTTAAAHGLRDGDRVTISGATQTAYNGEFVISINPNSLPLTTFTYTVAGSPATPATGTITFRRQQMWVCKTGDASPSTSGQHTAAAAFSTDKATHWIQVDASKEGNLSVWADLTIQNTLFGGEGGGLGPVVWNLPPDSAWTTTTGTVTYPRGVRVIDSNIGSNVRSGVRRTNLSGSIAARTSRTVSSITRSGTTATVTTSTAHGLVTGDKVIIEGASQSEYNGEQTVNVTNTTVFTYTVSGSPATPATGTITALVAYVKSSSTTATVKTLAAHGLFSGQKVTISGASQTEYNGEYSITVTSAKEFTYTFAGSATTPATGTILIENHLSVAPTVLWVQVPNHTEVRNNKYSFTQQVAADFWVAAASTPTIWTPTRFKPLQAVADNNYGGIQSNLYTNGGNWHDLNPNYMPSAAVCPEYTQDGTAMYIPTGAKIVRANFDEAGDTTIYAFYNTYNGQQFTVLCNAKTIIANSPGFIRTYDAVNFDPGATGASSGLITFVVCDGVAYEISRSDLDA